MPFFDVDGAAGRRLLILLCPVAPGIGIYDLDHGLNRLGAPVIAVSMLVIGIAVALLEWAVALPAGRDGINGTL
jgi:hypothetical protein